MWGTRGYRWVCWPVVALLGHTLGGSCQRTHTTAFLTPATPSLSAHACTRVALLSPYPCPPPLPSCQHTPSLPRTPSLPLQDIAVSSGSACTSASLEPSYVLRALGVEEELAHTSIRYGLGRFTTPEEVDHAVALTVSHVNKLREMSPLWEMVQEGIDLKSIEWAQH